MSSLIPLDPSEYTADPRKGGHAERGRSGVLREILDEEEVVAWPDMEVWGVLETSGHVCMAPSGHSCCVV